MATGMATDMRKTHKADSKVKALLILATALGAVDIYAQELAAEEEPKHAVTIVPRISVTETLTDNVRLNNTGAQSEQITEISPGLRVNVNGARVKGYFDYALNELSYGQASSANRFQNALSSVATVEALENWAFVDFSASIAQQTISAFGTQSVDNTSLNSNSTEVSSYRLSPYLRGRITPQVNYEARLERMLTRSGSTVAPDGNTSAASVRVNESSSFRSLGWSVDANQRNLDYSVGRATRDEHWNLALSYGVTQQFTVTVNGGREANNYTSPNMETFGTGGYGFDWGLAGATHLSGSQDQHSFGTAHRLNFEHRTPRTIWRFTDSKDVIQTPNQTGQVSLGNVYELLDRQFAAQEPDPVARAQLVNAYLQTYGLAPNTPVVAGFITSAVSLQNRQDFSVAIQGIRDTLMLIVSQGDTQRIDTLTTGTDDLSSSSFVHQNGTSLSLSHRLTPDYSLGVLWSQQNTSGITSSLDSSLQTLSVNITGKLGKKSTASVSARRVQSVGGAVPYVENAVIGNLNMQF